MRFASAAALNLCCFCGPDVAIRPHHTVTDFAASVASQNLDDVSAFNSRSALTV
jgi:hypothetical protein